MLELTAADIVSIANCDSVYINEKGAKLYVEGNYADAVEYYRLAAMMGNVDSISNLGYCYLYGMDIEQNIPLAIEYFKIAAWRKNPEAAYKLGDIYGSEKWGLMDKELSIYYYTIAANLILGPDWEEGNAIIYNDELRHYPSLCYALAREMSFGGLMKMDIGLAYQFLKKAKDGYEIFLANGETMYLESYNGVLSLLEDHQFDAIREKYDDANT